MDINEKDHPELYAAKLRRLKRRVAEIVAESREDHRLLTLKQEQEALQRQQALELLQNRPHLKLVE